MSEATKTAKNENVSTPLRGRKNLSPQSTGLLVSSTPMPRFVLIGGALIGWATYYVGNTYALTFGRRHLIEQFGEARVSG